ncbi:hypothetical protein [Lactobacillus apis]|uniref:hypothetical protein n=1 Tax=Lactobacillus apis TaxID=303541 RepID=UPI00242E24B1|nr:hypothetical protein [Lactobacillus apis]
MTTIKMNDGRTQYDVEENYGRVCDLIQSTQGKGDKFLELTESDYGKVWININNILSVRESKDYEK